MKKQFLAGILAMALSGIYAPAAFADSVSPVMEKSSSVAYAFIEEVKPATNGPVNIPGLNKPSNNGNVITIVPNQTNGEIKKTQLPKDKIKKHKVHKHRVPKIHRKPKPGDAISINKPAKPGDAPVINKPHKPHRPHKPVAPNGIYKPNKPAVPNGVYKPSNPVPNKPTTARTQVHGPHWCYGACSLHDAGLHNAPRTEKHWCDGYR